MYISKYKNFLLVVEQDEFPLNPREDYDNFGTMICFHNKYILGDDNNFSSVRDLFLKILFKEYENKPLRDNKLLQFIISNKATDIYVSIDEHENYNFYTRFDSSSQFDKYPDKVVSKIELENETPTDYIELLLDALYDEEMYEIIVDIEDIVILPLYLLDHSGLSISTHSFNDRWDSGHVGYIYCTKEKIIEEYGKFNDYTIAKAKQVLETEVEFYDHYLKGDTYCFSLYDINDKEYIESCGGFIGDFEDIIDDVLCQTGLSDEYRTMLKENINFVNSLKTITTIDYDYYKNMED